MTNETKSLENCIKSDRVATIDSFKKSVKYSLATLGICAVAKVFDTPIMAIPEVAGIMYFGLKAASNLGDCAEYFLEVLNNSAYLKDLKGKQNDF